MVRCWDLRKLVPVKQLKKFMLAFFLFALYMALCYEFSVYFRKFSSDELRRIRKNGEASRSTEKFNDVTILDFPRSGSNGKGKGAIVNRRTMCGLSFDCFLFPDEPNLNLNNFSAILTHGDSGLTRFKKRWESSGLKRDPKQLWIAESLESSPNSANYHGIEDSPLRGMFNWTFFLSRNATFINDYFHILKRNTPIPFSDVIKEYKQLEKSRDFCWLVSNCGTWTPRFELAASIINHLPSKLHIWGSAAQNCLRNYNASKVHIYGRISGSSWKTIVQSCKFYFAFENSNCTDYITEKFSGALRDFAVPIVNGYRESYNRVLPGGFIFPPDFKNKQEMGRYLKYLLENEDAYMEYHRWRTHYVKGDSPAKCEMCKKLSETVRDYGTPQAKSYVIKDLVNEYRTLETCDPPVAPMK